MKAFACILLLAVTTACSVEQVQYAKQQPGVNFAAYKTYNFLDVKARNETDYPGQVHGVPELKYAIGNELERRGYKLAENPDVWVNIGIVTRDKVQTRQTDIHDAPVYLGQRRYSWKSEEIVVNKYEEGTATVEIVDAARNEMVWQGAVASALARDYDKRTRRIEKAVETLFEKYPVPAR
jgi:hypothetical protein